MEEPESVGRIVDKQTRVGVPESRECRTEQTASPTVSLPSATVPPITATSSAVLSPEPRYQQANSPSPGHLHHATAVVMQVLLVGKSSSLWNSIFGSGEFRLPVLESAAVIRAPPTLTASAIPPLTVIRELTSRPPHRAWISYDMCLALPPPRYRTTACPNAQSAACTIRRLLQNVLQDLEKQNSRREIEPSPPNGHLLRMNGQTIFSFRRSITSMRFAMEAGSPFAYLQKLVAKDVVSLVKCTLNYVLRERETMSSRIKICRICSLVLTFALALISGVKADGQKVANRIANRGLVTSAEKGDLAKLNYWLHHGADVNATRSGRRHSAAGRGGERKSGLCAQVDREKGKRQR